MLENPWDVEYLEEYLVYSCPECRNLSQNEDEFLEHALENHPHSRQSLMRFLVKEEKKPLEFNELKEKLNKLFDNSNLEKQEVKNDSSEVQTNDVVQRVMFGSNAEPTHDDPLALQTFSQFEDQQEGDGDKTLLCGNCKALFHSLKYLKIHMDMCNTRKDDSGKVVGTTCQECSKEFDNLLQLRNHIDKDHKKLEFKCEHCGKEYKSHSSYYAHIKYACDKLHQPVVCDTCGKSFLSPGSLRNHIKLHHNDLERNFQCDECEKRFFYISALTQHKKQVHLGIKPEKNKQCPHCEYKCSSQSVLDIHIASTHEGKRDYHCELCPKTFARIGGLKTHIKIVHENVRNHVCETCGNRYANKHILKDHIDAVHKQMRKWNCEYCGKTYSMKEGLRVHVQTVHEGIRFSCYRCNKSFTQKQNLKKHIKETYNLEYKDYLECQKAFEALVGKKNESSPM